MAFTDVMMTSINQIGIFLGWCSYNVSFLLLLQGGLKLSILLLVNSIKQPMIINMSCLTGQDKSFLHILHRGMYNGDHKSQSHQELVTKHFTTCNQSDNRAYFQTNDGNQGILWSFPTFVSLSFYARLAPVMKSGLLMVVTLLQGGDKGKWTNSETCC